MAKDFDVVVIGSGPAGYRCAMQTVKLGKRVCIVEKTPGRVGGTWIHTGTIPSKTLRESMEAIHNIAYHAGEHWVERIVSDLSTSRLLGRSRQAAECEEEILRRYFDRYNIEIIEGTGSILAPGEVQVELADGKQKKISCSNILISTGSRPRRPDEVPFDGWRIADADEILQIEKVPKNMIIYGAGVIGCEYACIFSALGVEVTLVDGREGIMPYMDQEVAGALMKSMAASGVKFVMGSKMATVGVESTSAKLTLQNKQELSASLLLFAAGRTPNTGNLGLEKLGIDLGHRCQIPVDENFQTTVPGIYAAGDCIGPPALAATSAAQGRHVALHMNGLATRPFPSDAPIGVYTIPEMSSVGQSEQQLTENNIPYVVGRAHYREVARGFIRGDQHGMLKLLVHAKTHELVGIHIVGHDACNLVHIGLAFMQKKGHVQDFVDMVFNYPTLAEAYKIAAFNALNKIFPDGIYQEPPADGAS